MPTLITTGLASARPFGVGFRSVHTMAYILQQLSVTPAAAYSVRQLSGTYTGPLLRVGTTDLYAGSNGVVDLTPVGGSGTVTIWYDQSGHGANASVGGGSVTISNSTNLIGGFPVLNFTSSYFNVNYTQTNANYQTVAVVGRPGSSSSFSNNPLWVTRGSGAGMSLTVIFNTSYLQNEVDSNNIIAQPSAVPTGLSSSTAYSLAQSINVVNGTSYFVQNGIVTTGTMPTTYQNNTGLNTLMGYSQAWGTYFSSTLSEFILFSVITPSSDMVNLNLNQKSFYNT